MPKIAYQPFNFHRASLEIILKANEIIDEYMAQGYDLTLRQLYYQFVSRGFIANQQSEYKKLGEIVNNGRLAGLIDWNAITDRTRNLESLSHWSDPQEIIQACEQSFRIDKWNNQANRIEVWIEKDALTGILEKTCPPLDVPYFSCRGYTSQSEMWRAAQRLLKYVKAGQIPVILHLGDHDPSGCDMSRDIQDRLELFMGDRVEFTRLALNMNQVDEYNPPENPAKITDTRADKYIQEYGIHSWELDALDPTVLNDLIVNAVNKYRDMDQWGKDEEDEERMRLELTSVREDWDNVIQRLADEKSNDDD